MLQLTHVSRVRILLLRDRIGRRIQLVDRTKFSPGSYEQLSGLVNMWFKRLETARLKPRPFKNPIYETRSRDKSRTSGRAAQIQRCGCAAGAGLFGAASSCCVWPFWTESMLPWSEPGLRSKLWS